MSFEAFNCCRFLVLMILFPSACHNTLHVSPEVRSWMLGAMRVNRVPHMGGTTSPDIAAKERETGVNADHPTCSPSRGPSLLCLCSDAQGSQTRSALSYSQLCSWPCCVGKSTSWGEGIVVPRFPQAFLALQPPVKAFSERGNTEFWLRMCLHILFTKQREAHSVERQEPDWL